MKKKFTFFLFLLCLIAGRSMATIIYVDSASTATVPLGTSWASAFRNFQTGINSAEAGDSVWVAQGTYFTVGAPFEMKDSVKIFGGFMNADTSFLQRNWSLNKTILEQGYSSGPIMENDVFGKTYAGSLLDGFIFQNSTFGWEGGAVHNEYASITFANCSFINNTVTESGGGAVYNYYAEITFLNCIFSGNSGNDHGGAIRQMQGTLRVVDCLFKNNEAGGTGGGAISSNAKLVIDNCIFENNKASFRGGAVSFIFSDSLIVRNSVFNANTCISDYGLYSGGGALSVDGSSGMRMEITKCLFLKNKTNGQGGAIYSSLTSSAALGMIEKCTFSNDSAKSGGAIFCYGNTPQKIHNCSFVSNSADSGAAISNNNSKAIIANNLLYRNKATYGSAIMNRNASPKIVNNTLAQNYGGGSVLNYSYSSPQITNSIIWGNDEGIQTDVSSSVEVQYSLVQGMEASITDHNLDGDIDPFFADTALDDYRILSTSPCINKGTNDSIPEFITEDLAGNNRIESDTVDIGAYEYKLMLPETALGNDTTFCGGNTITLNAGNFECSYLWNTGDTTKTIQVTETGNYSVAVTNILGTARDTIVVTVLSQPAINFPEDTVLCTGSYMTLDAGNAGSTYIWNVDSFTQTITIDIEGTYSVTVTDSNSCVNSDTVLVSIGELPVVTLGNDTTFCSGNSLTLDAQNTGATYTWNNGDITQTSIINSSDTVSVIVTDINNCVASDTVIVTVDTLPIINLGSDTSICPGNTLTLNASYYMADYLWSSGATTATVNVSSEGTYSVMVTDGHTCTAGDTIEISMLPAPDIDLGADISVCSGTSTVLNAGYPDAVYLWNTGATTETITVSTAGNYRVSVTGENGCVGRDTVHLSVNPLPIVNLGNDTTISSSATLILNAGNPGSSYIWSTGATTQTIETTGAGEYWVTVTNGDDCTAADTIEIMTGSVGIKDVLSDADRTTLFPNPANDHITVNIKNRKLLNTQLFLIDAYGRTVRSWPIVKENQSFPMEGVATGMYIIKLDSGETFKIVKQ